MDKWWGLDIYVGTDLGGLDIGEKPSTMHPSVDILLALLVQQPIAQLTKNFMD